MPDKHEVGGSTPLEPTSRQCRQPTVRIAARNPSETDRRYNRLTNDKSHSQVKLKRMFIEN